MKQNLLFTLIIIVIISCKKNETTINNNVETNDNHLIVGFKFKGYESGKGGSDSGKVEFINDSTCIFTQWKAGPTGYTNQHGLLFKLKGDSLVVYWPDHYDYLNMRGVLNSSKTNYKGKSTYISDTSYGQFNFNKF